MAFYIVPGVYFKETDFSQYVPNVAATIPGMVVTASRGRMNEKTYCSTLIQYQEKFGAPEEAHPGSLAAREFFENGGTQAWIVRVGDGSEAKATVDVSLINGDDLTVESVDEGTFYNKIKISISHTNQKNTSLSSSQSLTNGTINFTKTIPNKPVVPNTVLIKDGSTVMGRDDGNGSIVFESAYSVFTATVNYKTGAIVFGGTWAGGSVSKTINITASYYSTFQVQLRYIAKNSDNVVVSQSILEVFADQTITSLKNSLASSKYIRIAANPAAVPDAGDFQMTGGEDGTDDLLDAHYIGDTIGAPTGLQIFSRADQVDINLAAVPGVSSLSVRQALVDLVVNKRRDVLAIMDPPSNITTQAVVDWANGDGTYAAYDTVDCNRAAIYFPYYSSYNSVNANIESTPPSAAALAAFARSDIHEAPAGPNRGKIINIRDIQVELSDGDRQLLAANRINPLSDLMNTGVQVAGQRTATLTNSALDRVGARMMVSKIQKEVTKALVPLMFEPATQRTWRRAELIIQPFLDGLVAQGKIYYGLFICNASTNPNDAVTNNQMGCACLLKPLKYAEAIVVNFIILDYGAKVEEVLTQLNLAA